jgi:hypothetical protein
MMLELQIMLRRRQQLTPKRSEALMASESSADAARRVAIEYWRTAIRQMVSQGRAVREADKQDFTFTLHYKAAISTIDIVEDYEI